MPREDYMKELKEVVRSTYMSSIPGYMKGKQFYNVVEDINFIHHEIKHIFTIKPTFTKYIEVD